MRKIKFVLCVVLVSVIPAIGYSQLYLEETFFPVYVKKNDLKKEIGGSVGEAIPSESGIGYDFRTTIGYTFTNGIILALTYNLFNVKSSQPQVDDEDSRERELSKNELGPTIGYTLGAWRFLFTYFLTAEKSLKDKAVLFDGTPSTDETYTNHDGKGIQLTVNYSLNLGGGFEIGPSLIYRSIEYSKQSLEVRNGASTPYSKVTLATPAIDAELKPMVTVVYRY